MMKRSLLCLGLGWVLLSSQNAAADPEVVVQPGPGPDDPGVLEVWMPAPPIIVVQPTPQMTPAPIILRAPAPARPPAQLNVSLGFTSGITGFGVIWTGHSHGASASVGGDLRFLWKSRFVKAALGFRLFGSAGIRMQGNKDGFLDDSDSTLYGAGLYDVGAAFVVDISGFWISTGISVAYMQVANTKTTLPGVSVGLGYDIPLGRFLALRLYAQGSTLLLWGNGQLGGGLVARF
jgi:hypothetical protein